MERRSFFSRLGVAAAALGLGGAHVSAEQAPAPAAAAAPPPAAPAPWQAARHAQDDWFDELPGRHRVIFDAWTAAKFGESFAFAGNYYRVNRDIYTVADRDLAVVLCVRHQAVPFAFNDAMWAKYGSAFTRRMDWVDPKTKEAPVTNVHLRQLSNFVRQGMQLAVCNVSTRNFTQIIARQTQTSADEVYKELTANTVGNCHFVPAGVVAVTRAQERGYALVAIG